MSRPSYTVNARFDPQEARWSIEGLDLPTGYVLVAQTRRIDGLEAAARQGISLLLDLPADGFDVEVVIDRSAPAAPDFLF